MRLTVRLLGITFLAIGLAFTGTGCGEDGHGHDRIDVVTIVSFESIDPGVSGTHIGAAFLEQGYDIGAPSGLDILGSSDAAFIGSTAIFTSVAGEFADVIRPDGRLFLPREIAIASLHVDPFGDPIPFTLELSGLDEFRRAFQSVLLIDPIAIAHAGSLPVEAFGRQLVVFLDLRGQNFPFLESFAWRCECQVDKIELLHVE
jgi:hypothetical protein